MRDESDESMTQPHRSGQATSDLSDRDVQAPGHIPIQETEQPDPMLQLTTGYMGAGGITLVAFAVAVILDIVFYGLNSGSSAQHTAAAPPSAAQSAKAPAGGKPGAPTPSAPRANNSGNG